MESSHLTQQVSDAKRICSAYPIKHEPIPTGVLFYHYLYDLILKGKKIHLNIPDTLVAGYENEPPSWIETGKQGFLTLKKIEKPEAEISKKINSFATHNSNVQKFAGKDLFFPIAYGRMIESGRVCRDLFVDPKNVIDYGLRLSLKSVPGFIQRFVIPRTQKASMIRMMWRQRDGFEEKKAYTFSNDKDDSSLYERLRTLNKDNALKKFEISQDPNSKSNGTPSSSSSLKTTKDGKETMALPAVANKAMAENPERARERRIREEIDKNFSQRDIQGAFCVMVDLAHSLKVNPISYGACSSMISYIAKLVSQTLASKGKRLVYLLADFCQDATGRWYFLQVSHYEFQSIRKVRRSQSCKSIDFTSTSLLRAVPSPISPSIKCAGDICRKFPEAIEEHKWHNSVHSAQTIKSLLRNSSSSKLDKMSVERGSQYYTMKQNILLDRNIRAAHPELVRAHEVPERELLIRYYNQEFIMNKDCSVDVFDRVAVCATCYNYYKKLENMISAYERICREGRFEFEVSSPRTQLKFGGFSSSTIGTTSSTSSSTSLSRKAPLLGSFAAVTARADTQESEEHDHHKTRESGAYTERGERRKPHFKKALTLKQLETMEKSYSPAKRAAMRHPGVGSPTRIRKLRPLKCSPHEMFSLNLVPQTTTNLRHREKKMRNMASIRLATE